MHCELIDNMGDDLRVVNSARVSFDKESEWNITGYTSEICKNPEERCYYEYPVYELKKEDVNLIRYLANHSHWTPFSHCIITLRETIPIFVARERFRHTVGFTYNEVSRRYVDTPPEFFSPDVWRKRSENKKQGSSEEEITEIDLGLGSVLISSQYEMHLKSSLGLYNDLIKSGVAPEQARIVLPQSMYTSYYVTGSLAAFARAYKLRSQPDAQKEIQELAAMWNDIIRKLYPISWGALVDQNCFSLR